MFVFSFFVINEVLLKKNNNNNNNNSNSNKSNNNNTSLLWWILEGLKMNSAFLSIAFSDWPNYNNLEFTMM